MLNLPDQASGAEEIWFRQYENVGLDEARLATLLLCVKQQWDVYVAGVDAAIETGQVSDNLAQVLADRERCLRAGHAWLSPKSRSVYEEFPQDARMKPVTEWLKRLISSLLADLPFEYWDIRFEQFEFKRGGKDHFVSAYRFLLRMCRDDSGCDPGRWLMADLRGLAHAQMLACARSYTTSPDRDHALMTELCGAIASKRGVPLDGLRVRHSQITGAFSAFIRGDQVDFVTLEKRGLEPAMCAEVLWLAGANVNRTERAIDRLDEVVVATGPDHSDGEGRGEIVDVCRDPVIRIPGCDVGVREDTVCIVAVTPRFWKPRHLQAELTAMRRMGFELRAALYVPTELQAGRWRKTGDGYILIATRVGAVLPPPRPDGAMFVAELNQDEGRTSQVFANLLDGVRGKMPETGCFVDPLKFSGFPSFVSGVWLREIQRRIPNGWQHLGELVTEVGSVDLDAVTDRTLFLYSRTNARHDATTNPDATRHGRGQWFMLQLDQEKVEPDYLAAWLSSASGWCAVKASAVGPNAGRLRQSDIGNIEVCVPSIEEQRARLGLEAKARELESRARTVSKRACEPLFTLAGLQESLAMDEVQSAQSLEQWSDELPFPLASILRRFQREAQDPERAAGVLLHFFEAFGEYWATILLSALEQAGEIPGKVSVEIREELESKGVHPLERSTMATWIFVGGKLASWLRARLDAGLSGEEDREEEPLDPLCTLATRNRGAIEALLSKAIPTILGRTAHIRNNSRGHGGAVSVSSAKLLLDRLSSELSQLRDVAAPIFEVLKMYRLGSAEIGAGVRTYEVEVLKGSNATFLREKLVLEDEPPSRSLVVSAGEGRSLPLLPLVRMAAPQDEGNACYFFSRTENETARFVSYHQGDQAEDLDPAPMDFLRRWQQGVAADGATEA